MMPAPAAITSSRACEDSLRRLQTDHIDLYQLHRPPPPHLPQDETLRAMDDLVRAGQSALYRLIHLPCLDADGRLWRSASGMAGRAMSASSRLITCSTGALKMS